MQQKAKFIISLTLICFISLLFLPREVWSLGNYPFPTGETPSDCTTDTKKCVDGYSEWQPASGTPGTDSYYPAGYDFVCTEWETVIEGDPSCSGSGGGTPPPPEEEEEKYDGWMCSSTGSCSSGGCYGKCLYRTNMNSPLYDTEAGCLSACNFSCRCRGSNNPLFGPRNVCRCMSGSTIQKCAVDADCNNGTPPPTAPKYSCNTSTGTCSENSNGVYSSLSVCEDHCKPSGTLSCPGNDYCYACNKTTYQCYKSSAGPYTTLNMCKDHCRAPSTGPTSPTPTSPPPTSPTPPKCQIFEFSINGKTNEDRDPLLVWVNALLKGYISVNDSCTECTVTSDDTWGNPPKTYTITSLNTRINQLFEIPQSGTYSFTVECIGDPADPDDFAKDTVSLKTVEALNLPWWREIIPVLPGFLRGIWR